MDIKGIDVSEMRAFCDDKKFMAKMWSTILGKIGEDRVRENFRELFSDSTYQKFPEKLTEENLCSTILAFKREDLKYNNR